MYRAVVIVLVVAVCALEAYLYHNPAGYAELYVKVGARLLTLQRSIDMGQTIGDVRAGTIALANALVAKLR